MLSVYEHYRKDEHAFVDQVMDWKQTCEDQYSPKLTDFLDPRQQMIAENLIGSQGDVMIRFFGGGKGTERKRAMIFPDYYQASDDDFAIVLFQVHYPGKFVSIEHPQVLGALMNLGLKREKFGDIIQDGTTLQFACAEEVSDYIEMNVQKIGKSSVDLERISLDRILEAGDTWRESMITVSSMRLDTVASEMFNVSRSKMKTIIDGELVKVNWKVTTDKSMRLMPGDVLSVRGKGRGKIIAEEGVTKKDRVRLIIGFPE
ncbi:RNA-binding protein [Alteribacter keqinensis]|uniref:YlmH family RNA-binding protein n=1 Tax=Alteribacter keqinensis TaxID=2483800 RepID=UPI0026B1C93C